MTFASHIHVQDAAPCVYLVGAGPGDPELLTLKALRLIQNADAVVYDRLIGEAILDFLPPAAHRVYVGKAASNHTMRQEEINRLLVDLAGSFRRIVRLKGGDPFIFGRGGEEAEVLQAAGIRCEVVPGITSAAGCAAATGIPLTHRGLAASVKFITGHMREDSADDLDWSRHADADSTLVIYMGLAAAARIASGLMAGGLPAEFPVAVISSATTQRQHTLITDLGHLAGEIARHAMASPALIIVGHVVELAGLTDAPNLDMLAGSALWRESFLKAVAAPNA